MRLMQLKKGWMEEMKMTINEYQKKAMRTCSIPREMKEDMLHHAIHGLNSESGEVAGVVQKVYQHHDYKKNPQVDVIEEMNKEHMKKELGDCLWMIAEICMVLDFTLEDVMQTNIDKLLARFPEGFEVERSLHRAEGDI